MAKNRRSRRKVSQRSTVLGLIGVGLGALAGSQDSLKPVDDAATLGIVNGVIFYVLARWFFSWREERKRS